jgi:hypothetical protein
MIRAIRSLATGGALALGALTWGLVGTPAEAATINWSLTSEFSGGATPSGSGPWGFATFMDTAPGVVQLTLELALLPSEFLTEWDFNLDPGLSPLSLSVTRTGGTGPAAEYITIDKGVNAFNADGDGQYDLQFEFATSNSGGGVRRFNGTENLTFNITCTSCSGFDAESFEFPSAPDGGHGPFLHAAHIQGLSTPPGSGWLTGEGGGGGAQVPTPGSLVLVGLGAVGVAVGGLRRTRRA